LISATYELVYLQTSVGLIEDYLLSPEIYWSLRAKPRVGDPPYPMLTLGGILQARIKAKCRSLTTSQQVLLGDLNDQIEAAHLRWRVAWETKATHEYRSRLILWRDFLGEYRRQPANHVNRYAYEVNRRVIIQLLAPYASGAPSIEIDLLTALDKMLKGAFEPGEFIWEAELGQGFPRDKYWYLWGRLRK
jgi:hypothetical protein